MDDGYRVLHFSDGEQVEETRHAARADAESAFALGVDRATCRNDEDGTEWRVELWGRDSLLALFDTADRP